MWRPAGQLLRSSSAALPSVALASMLTIRAAALPMQTSASSRPSSGLCSTLRPSVVWPTPAPRARQTGSVGASWLRALLIALCLTTLPGCWWISRKEAVAPPPKCPLVQCLDRALQLHPGVTADMPRNCADAVVVATDGLTALIETQAAHAELIRCVEQFNAEAAERAK